jgi:hypothetical protein
MMGGNVGQHPRGKLLLDNGADVNAAIDPKNGMTASISRYCG